MCQPFPGKERVTNDRGEFQLPDGEFNTIARGTTARLLVRLRDGKEHEVSAVPDNKGIVTVKVPARHHSRQA